MSRTQQTLFNGHCPANIRSLNTRPQFRRATHKECMAVGGRGDRLGAPPHPHVTAQAAHGHQTLPQPLSRELPRRKSDREEHDTGDHHNKHTNHNIKPARQQGKRPPGGTRSPIHNQGVQYPLGPTLCARKSALTRRPKPSQGSRAGQQPMLLREANTYPPRSSPPPGRQATMRDATLTRPSSPPLARHNPSMVGRGPGTAGPRNRSHPNRPHQAHTFLPAISFPPGSAVAQVQRIQGTDPNRPHQAQPPKTRPWPRSSKLKKNSPKRPTPGPATGRNDTPSS